MLDKTNKEIPVEIGYQDLSLELLNNIIESFILREGTDYGAQEISLEKKTEQVLKQIQSGRVKIYFDQATETVSLISANAPR
jgi:uncharacterized protein YheU (UPF0270 family)